MLALYCSSVHNHLTHTYYWRWLLLAFALSVALRWPSISRPLSQHHELNSAAVLVCIKAWQQAGGPAAYWYTPIQFYTHVASQQWPQPPTPLGKILQSGGYFAVGPGSYLLPYVGFTALGISPSPLAINVFNLCLQLVVLWLLYGLASTSYRWLKPQGHEAAARQFGFYAALGYLCLPITLWYHANAYNHEVAIIPLVLAAQWMALRMLQKPANLAQVCLLAVLVAAATATDWLGALAAAGIGTTLLMYWPASPGKRLLLAFGLGLVVLTTVVLILYCYHHLIGWPALAYFFTSSFGRRAVLHTHEYHWGHWMAYAAVGAGVMGLLALRAVWQQRKQWRQPRTLAWVLIIAAPALVHTLLLSSFSQEHDYALLKWMPLVSMLAAAARPSWVQHEWALAGMVLANLTIYYLVNPPAINQTLSQRYSRFARMGQAVQQQVPADAVLMVVPNQYYHQLEWYADRHYWPMPDSATAVRMARMYGLSKVWLLTPDPQYGEPRLTALTK
jgi:hypothetical protein